MTIQVIILAALLGVHYRHVIHRLVYIWSHNGDWSHGFLIPVFSLYYLHTQRDRMPTGFAARGAFSMLIGAAVVTVGFAMLVTSVLVQMAYPQALSLVVTILGIVLMVCGWPATRWSWFAIAFLVFALPVPVRLYVQMTMPLRYIAADVSAALLSASIPDMLAQPRGALVEYIYRGEPGTLDIEQACSGIRLMMTMMALGVAMAFMSDRPIWQRLVMILSCVPIAIVCNVVRVTVTGFFFVLGHEEWARGFWHTMLGLGMLTIAFGLFKAISYVLAHLIEDDESEDQMEMVVAEV
jgi:exosortase